MNERDDIKPKSFCPAKQIIDKPKRQPTEQEKTSIHYLTEKGLTSKPY